MNVLPSPGVLSTQILPPCASTNPLANERPNPEPDTLDLRALLLQ